MKITHRQLLGLIAKPSLEELEFRLDKAVARSHRNKNEDGCAQDRSILRTLKKNGWSPEEYIAKGGIWHFVYDY